MVGLPWTAFEHGVQWFGSDEVVVRFDWQCVAPVLADDRPIGAITVSGSPV